MFQAQNSRENLTSSYKANPYMAVYFCITVLACSFFLMNLYVGEVVSSYNRESERVGRANMLSDEQREWIETKIKI